MRSQTEDKVIIISATVIGLLVGVLSVYGEFAGLSNDTIQLFSMPLAMMHADTLLNNPLPQLTPIGHFSLIISYALLGLLTGVVFALSRHAFGR